ncbi:uncharacterized protein [Periplaneta americana]|uniref:uncharacterized protein n=1 Tax=Periplaneta americana TaxID=6978 RepID=UPI0037E861D3
MFWATVISTGIVLQISLQAAAYGAYPQTENGPPRSARTSTQAVNQLIFWDHNRPGIHGPQVDVNANNFQLQRDTAPFGGGDGFFRPSTSQNGARRRPQQLKFRPNLILPPGADGPDDVFIFDRPTSPRPGTTRRTTTTTTPASTATTACNCPSTDEFNPVCGSDRVTYSNPGRLKCAQLCGTDVNIKHYGSCLTTAAPTTSTTPTTN